MNVSLTRTVLILIAGIAGGSGLTYYLMVDDDPLQSVAVGSDRAPGKPLYWVAPMDPNYRRDAPGKSPMGMDLVPVYAREGGAGEVTVPANVQHNLGLRTAIVRRGAIEDRVPTLARIEIAEDQLSVVSPRIAGWLSKLHVKSTNQPVDPGQPLFEIYSPELVNAQEEYVAAMNSGNKLLVASARDRLRSLRVPSSVLDDLETNRNVRQTIVYPAQQGGLVSELTAREGSYVTPGTPIMVIAELDPVWITAEIVESTMAEVAAGDDMEVALPGGKVLLATVNFVQPVLDSLTRALEVRAIVPNPNGHLRPNMFAEASLRTRSRSDALWVPTEAIIRLENQNRVVVKDGPDLFKSIQVELGHVGSAKTEVVAGLGEGDEIVTSAQFLIDSESSKTSDFKRLFAANEQTASGMSAMDHGSMTHGEMDHSNMKGGDMDDSNMKDDMDHGNMKHGDMDHSNMKGGDMDHGNMKHGEMDHGDMDHGAMGDHQTSEHKPVWTSAAIKGVDHERRTITLTHEPIPEWQWPVMTMTMTAGPEVDLGTLEAGSRYRLHIRPAPDSATGYLVMHVEPAAGQR